MSWSQAAVYTGTWSFPCLPGAAIDGNDNLLIAWADDAQNLNLLYTNTTGGDGFPVIVVGGVQGSPCCIYGGDSFYVFWRAAGTGQLNYGILADPNDLSQGFRLTQALPGAFSNDGPQVTLAGGPGEPFPEPCIYVVWRGTGVDEQLYSGYLSNLNGSPSWSGGLPFTTNGSMQSTFSPTAGANQSGYMYSVWKGVDADPTLHFSYNLNFTNQSFSPLASLTTIDGTILATDDRPSLGVLSAGTSGGSIVVVFSYNGGMYFTIGNYSTLTVSGWADQEQIPMPELPNPRGVLVTTSSGAGSLYLLAGNRNSEADMTNVLYLYQLLTD